TYCAMTQAAYLWVGQLLVDRNKVLPENVPVAAEEPPAAAPKPWFSDYAPDDPTNARPAARGAALAGATGPAPAEGPPPPDRLRRERVARALGELFLAWGDAPRLDGAGRGVFARAQEELWRETVAEPPHDVPPAGCSRCPARCRLLPFVAPHLPALAETL